MNADSNLDNDGTRNDAVPAEDGVHPLAADSQPLESSGTSPSEFRLKGELSDTNSSLADKDDLIADSTHSELASDSNATDTYQPPSLRAAFRRYRVRGLL